MAVGRSSARTIRNSCISPRVPSLPTSYRAATMGSRVLLPTAKRAGWVIPQASADVHCAPVVGIVAVVPLERRRIRPDAGASGRGRDASASPGLTIRVRSGVRCSPRRPRSVVGFPSACASVFLCGYCLFALIRRSTSAFARATKPLRRRRFSVRHSAFPRPSSLDTRPSPLFLLPLTLDT